MQNTKYIVMKHGNLELLFTFPMEITHAHMAEVVKAIKEGVPQNWRRPYLYAEIVAAGFISPDGVCHGKSESLGIQSRAIIDTEILRAGSQRWTVCAT